MLIRSAATNVPTLTDVITLGAEITMGSQGFSVSQT